MLIYQYPSGEQIVTQAQLPCSPGNKRSGQAWFAAGYETDVETSTDKLMQVSARFIWHKLSFGGGIGQSRTN